MQSVAFDFKGNLLESRRRLATDYPAAEAMLEAELFTAHTAYDALNRPISLTAPDSSEIRPGYNEAGLLERVDVRVRGAALAQSATTRWSAGSARVAPKPVGSRRGSASRARISGGGMGETGLGVRVEWTR